MGGFQLATEEPRGRFRSTFCFEFSIRSGRSAEHTFAYLVDSRNEGEWFPGFVDARWETPPPHGVGSLRFFQTAELWIRERFVDWDPGHRLVFVGEATSLPLLAFFAESYDLHPRADGGATMTWKVTYVPRRRFRIFHPFLRPHFAAQFREAASRLTAALER